MAFGSVESCIFEYEQRGVRTSQGCKEAVIENIASNVIKRKEKTDIVELYYDMVSQSIKIWALFLTCQAFHWLKGVTRKKKCLDFYALGDHDYDFQKAYDNVNHAFLQELLDVYGFPLGTQMLIVEMMARWKIRLSFGAKRDVGDVRLTNGIIQGDAFSPLLFVLMIDPLIKI